MSLIDSIAWHKLQMIINWLLLPFIFDEHDDYILVGATSYRLGLGGKETYVLLQLIKLKALQLMDDGVLKRVPELELRENSQIHHRQRGRRERH